MKTLNKILALIILLAGIIFSTLKVNAQCYNNFGTPARSEFQSYWPTSDFVYNPACTSPTGIAPLVGLGINSYIYNSSNLPNYMLDILCDPTASTPTNRDVNVGCPNCSPADAVGYRIGGNMFLWHGGNLNNLMVGYLAGNATMTGNGNTFIGQSAGLGTTIGFENTFTGSNCGSSNHYGTANTFNGFGAGILNTNGVANTFMGTAAGYNIDTGSYNTYIGDYCGYSDVDGGFNSFLGYYAGKAVVGSYLAAGVPGCYNTMCGVYCGGQVTTGKANSYYGKKAGYYNTKGDFNCMYGSHSGCPPSAPPTQYISDSESFFGTYSGANFHFGHDNVIMGFGEGENTGSINNDTSSDNVFLGGNGLSAGMINPGGKFNVTLGFDADAYTGSAANPGLINNAVAIGASAIVKRNNQIILGNNSQFTGIGLSNDLSANPGPGWNLEICTENNPTYSLPGLGGGAYNALNTYGGSGFSGLKFRDLTSSSTPVDPNSLLWNQNNPYPNGILSLDGFGNVIYIPTSGTLGSCAKPTTLTNDADIDLNGYNLYFYGDGAGTTVNNVYIGAPTCPAPQPGKLTVFQTSGSSTTSTGLFVINTDGTNPSVAPYYGIYDVVPAGSQTNCVANIAGYFDANGTLPFVCSTNTITPIAPVDYALFTPPNGGGQNIGFAIGAPFTDPSQLLIVNSGILAIANYYPSDSILKKNVAPMKNGLDVIRKIQPVSYKYNGLAGIDTFGTHYGLIAQNLQRVAPYAVGSMTVRLDTSSTTRTPVLKIDQAAVMYTAINALKQVDSNETAHHKTDSAKIAKQQRTIDSLGNVLTNIQTCLATLCPGDGGHAPIRNNGGNDSSGTGSSSPSNVQNISLAGSFNEPILYQNTPNPFSTGTSINYFLPEGTMGAKMLFFDSYGKQLKSVDLSQTPGSPQASGNGTLNITPDNLQSGIYSYSLVVDNKVIDTKRMVLQK